MKKALFKSAKNTKSHPELVSGSPEITEQACNNNGGIIILAKQKGQIK